MLPQDESYFWMETESNLLQYIYFKVVAGRSLLHKGFYKQSMILF